MRGTRHEDVRVGKASQGAGAGVFPTASITLPMTEFCGRIHHRPQVPVAGNNVRCAIIPLGVCRTRTYELQTRGTGLESVRVGKAPRGAGTTVFHNVPSTFLVSELLRVGT